MKKIYGVVILSLLPVLSWATAPEDYFNAGQDLLKNHDFAKAIEYFHEAVDERPDYWQAYQLLGEAYYQNANRTEAVVAMEESLKLHPNNPELKKFMNKVKMDSPWESSDSIKGALTFLAIILSLLSLVWNAYLTKRLGLFKKKNN